MNTQRVGLYLWGGPGTIRMIRLKFFDPKIDEESLMRSYEYDYLARMRDTFGITDVWATYSWGFSDEREKEDREFLVSKAENFTRLGLRLHAYIQGANLVYRDFPDSDWWARDERGRLIPYHRGRKVTCLNNPGFRAYVASKIRRMRGLGFDGVFMDNIQMGQLAMGARHRLLAFAGCACDYCKTLFEDATGHEIPRRLRNDAITHEYLAFRAASTTSFIEAAANEAHDARLLFGSNSFDPSFDTEVVFGTDLGEIARIQDYLLFENHAFPRRGVSHNLPAELIAREIRKPVFVVSYARGIGRDAALSQDQLNAWRGERQIATFSSCLKGSEYVTDGVWHNLDPFAYEMPVPAPIRFEAPSKKQPGKYVGAVSRLIPPLGLAVRHSYNPLMTRFMEGKRMRAYLDHVYHATIR